MYTHPAGYLLKNRPIPVSAVLQHRLEYEKSIALAGQLNLPRHSDLPKNWDSLAALSLILKHTRKTSPVLDAGGERYSVILPQLEALGYRNLTCINLAFKGNTRRGNIAYEYGDITRTLFKAGSFRAVTCLSVIEHGVALDAYFAEMSRILKPGGILFISTDYWQDPVDTGGKRAFGVPIKIFTPEDLAGAIALAARYGLELTGPLPTGCAEKVVEWKPYGLNYTFIYFALRKVKLPVR